MRIIVTGGAGFIGSWVCEAYISEGHEVLVIDNLSTGSENNIPQEAEFIECDVMDYMGLEKAFRQFHPEVVNHHAAQINVRDSVEDPSFDADVNIGGSLNVLRLCAEHKTEKFIFSSTGGALYGEPEKLPADESTPALPLSPYGISKLSTEHYVRYHSRNHGFGHMILRYRKRVRRKAEPRRRSRSNRDFLREHNQRKTLPHIRRRRTDEGLRTRPLTSPGLTCSPQASKKRGLLT